MLQLSQALRFSRTTSLAFVGAGGKTTALFHLAREVGSAIVTTSTHLGEWQSSQADRHLILESDSQLPTLGPLPQPGIVLVTGPLRDNRYVGISTKALEYLHAISKEKAIPLLIEADGGRQKPLKAPAVHEPTIPEFVDGVVVVVGLSALNKPVTEDWIHRLDVFKQICDVTEQALISPELIMKMLLHPEGGLKNIPLQARRIVLMNQADQIELRSIAGRMARQLLPHYHSVIISALAKSEIYAIQESVAGIILAAGGSERYGESKQLLEWHGKPLVEHVARVAISTGLTPIIVVAGAAAEEVETAIHHLPITIARNLSWHKGQSTSIHAGLRILPSGIGAVILILSDQPHITPNLLQSMVEKHAQLMSPIIAPLVHGQRANPVLFDQNTFDDLMSLKGVIGGRQIFPHYKLDYQSWIDENLLIDIDSPKDYINLLENG